MPPLNPPSFALGGGDGFCGFFFFPQLVVMVIIGDIWVLFPFHRWIAVVVDGGLRLRFGPVLDRAWIAADNFWFCLGLS